jgi:hypothetical protein
MTEEEGVALAAPGPAVSVGTADAVERGRRCINMLSLSRTCRFPPLMFITMRGEWRSSTLAGADGIDRRPVLKLCKRTSIVCARPRSKEPRARGPAGFR